MMRYEAIVAGVSSGGLSVIKTLSSLLPGDFPIPVIIVQHLSARSDGEWIRLLNNTSRLNIKEAEEKEKILPGNIYIAPPNYHLLVEDDKSFSLSIDERVNYARPSIDVLFETAAEVYREKLIGIVLTGANSDGSDGLKRIAEYGGVTIVQDPDTADARAMPASAIKAVQPDHILSVEDIIALLIKTAKESSHEAYHQD